MPTSFRFVPVDTGQSAPGRTRPLAHWAVATLTAVALLASGCTQPRASEVPSALAPPADQRYAMSVTARGVQIYECRAAADGSPAWTFVAPEAELYDASGSAMGRHGAGPHWEAADGSRITGQVRARADAPAPGAISWLLLSTTASGPQGAFSRVRSVQRIDTAGGATPAAPCTRESIGASARVPYTARYRLFAPA
jgi:hypothetical protein